MFKRLFLLAAAAVFLAEVSAQQLYINPKSGKDINPGTQSQPLKTIAEAAKRVNSNYNKEAATIILSGGVYPLTETVLFNNNKFTPENRLIIKAQVMPDDPNWTPQSMPIITSVVPGTITPKDGEEAKGLQIEVNHATIEGLRFAGSPDYYYIDGVQNRRYYPIWRGGKNLDDLLVTQCLFAGNVDVSPIRVAVIANGHGLVIDHCVFYGCQNSVVFWDAEGGTSYHDVMRYCLVYGNYFSGCWTTESTGDDFEFHHNIIANSRTAWVRDKSTHHYSAHDCVISGNTYVAGYGSDTGNVAGVSGLDFLKTEKVQPSGIIEIEKDQGKRNYLQLKDGSAGAELKGGLFKN